MSSKEHIWIPRLREYLADRRISRREFIRTSTLLGMSAGAAYMWAGKITGRPIAPPALAQDLPKGGVFKIAMRVPKINSPHTYSWIYDSNILRAVCGYMTRTGHDNVTRPHLVEKWEASEDLKTWTLSVRDVKWHSGRPLTAEDLGLEHQALPRPRDRLVRGRPNDGLHAEGDRTPARRTTRAIR